MSARGYRSALAALAGDLEFEQAATRLYGVFANQTEDPDIQALFMDFARGESGHVRGVRRMAETLTDDDSPVLFFCPLCGWEISFGSDPAEGAEAKCPMCPGRFRLRLSDDDWSLERISR